ncbi:MAG: hypothetical protein NTW03_16835 [Verrucomicrobia bacterium]|nr:hypothetical protein [Verrucomicrobiota bacterium]
MNRTKRPALINTPLQRGDRGRNLRVNRFNGFSHWVETVETVENPGASANTPLKRGVNEIACCQALRV